MVLTVPHSFHDEHVAGPIKPTRHWLLPRLLEFGAVLGNRGVSVLPPGYPHRVQVCSSDDEGVLMSLATKLRRAPQRIATGGFILNSGLNKLQADEATAQALHGFASGAYPFVAKVPPKTFLTALGVGETALGVALLLPIVPAGLAGLALTGFAGGLLYMYAKTPSLHDKYFRPTQAGTAIAKDIWIAGIGTSLVIDAAMNESPITSTE